MHKAKASRLRRVLLKGQGLTMGVDDRSDGNSAEGRETGPDPPCLCVQA